MLGQHPQMYGMPELHLFKCADVAEWFDRCRRETFPCGHGMRRAVAQLYFGGQTERTVLQARSWLMARMHLTTGQLLRTLAARVYPKTIIEKSPSIHFDLEALMRAFTMFPQARFIHLVRHPKGQGASVLNFMKVRASHGPIPPGHWLLKLSGPDPQHAWHALNRNICQFLESVPDEQKRTVRGEDLLADPDRAFLPTLEWLGMRTDRAAIVAMKHPEESPYAFLGPAGAEFGNDRLFLQDPVFRAQPAAAHSLSGSTPWATDGSALTPETVSLARSFGYI
jgi:hypothetical protein